MGKSLHIGTFGGIPLKVHWTFGLFILFVIYIALSNGVNLSQGIWFGTIVFSLFLCVVFHEYGHAYAAKRYGVKTKDIILSPIGGVARLEKLPENPKHEMIIALAGPLVNVIIAFVVGMILFLTIEETDIPIGLDILNIETIADFGILLFVLNVILFVFNLVPAFPMDGGRVLRSGLAMKMGRVRATKIASIVGRILAVGFVIFGLMSDQYILAMIGVFVFTSAAAEYQFAKVSSKLEEFSVGDIMRTTFTKLHIGDKYQIPLDLYTRNMESNFLVFDSLDYVVGTVPSMYINEVAKSELKGDTIVMQMMSKKIGYATPNDSLKEVYELMNKEGIAIIAVKSMEEIVGVIDRDGIRKVLSR